MKINYLFFFIILLFVGCSQTSPNSTYYVPADVETIQEAIELTKDGDMIIVSPGTYYENIDFSGKNIYLTSLYHTTKDSSYISETIIDGNYRGSVVTFSHREADTVLEGFTIENGFAGGGAGIFCGENTSTELKSLIIKNNSAAYGAGILYYHASNSTLSNVTISNNETLEDGSGGGISAYSTYLSVDNCKIFGNNADLGGGIFAFNSQVNINQTSLSYNSSRKGGATYCYLSSPIFTNVLITGNSASQIGNVLYCWFNSEPEFINTTIAFNNGKAHWGSFYLEYDSHAYFHNSIIWENNGSDFFFSPTSVPNSITFDYSNSPTSQLEIIMNDNGQSIWNDGNISANPLFIAPEENNFRLQSNSPCIYTGDPDSDFNNTNSTRNSMGAFGGPNGDWN